MPSARAVQYQDPCPHNPHETTLAGMPWLKRTARWFNPASRRDDLCPTKVLIGPNP
jgi:hypothetical protein